MPTGPATTSDLLAQSKLTTDEWLHAKRTTKTYAGYVKAGTKWLEDWVKVGQSLQAETLADVQEAMAHGDEEVANQARSDNIEVVSAVENGDMGNVGIRPAFANAFDVVGEHTPTVLQLFTTFKCEREGCKFSTAEGIRSAFKDYFEQCVTC